MSTPNDTPDNGSIKPSFDPVTVLNGSYRSVQSLLAKNVKDGTWGLYEVVALHTVEGQKQKRKTLLTILATARDELVGLKEKAAEAVALPAPKRELPPCPEGITQEIWEAIQAPPPSERLFIQRFGRYFRLIKGGTALGHYQQRAQAERAKTVYLQTGEII